MAVTSRGAPGRTGARFGRVRAVTGENKASAPYAHPGEVSKPQKGAAWGTSWARTRLGMRMRLRMKAGSSKERAKRGTPCCKAVTRARVSAVTSLPGDWADKKVPETQLAASVWRYGDDVDVDVDVASDRKGAVHRLITEAPDVKSLMSIAENHWRSFDAAAVVRATTWMAKFSSDAVSAPASSETSLQRLIVTHANEFSLRELVYLLVALAQLGWREDAHALETRTFQILTKTPDRPLEQLSRAEVARLVWALGRLQVKAPLGALKQLDAVSLKHVDAQMDLQHIMQTLWGFSQLSYRVGEEWPTKLKGVIHASSLSSLRPSEQALFSWSLCKACPRVDPALAQALKTEFTSSLKQYDLVSMNLMLKCFHVMHVTVSREIMEKCEVRCLNCLTKSDIKPLAEFIYRCVKTKHPVHIHTRRYIENAVHAKMTGSSQGGRSVIGSKDMALLMWSFAKLGHRPKDRFLNRLEAIFVGWNDDVKPMSPQALSLLIWAYAKLKLKVSEPLMEAHFSMVSGQIQRMNTQCLANILWSYGSLHLPVPEALFRDLIAQLQANLHQCNPQNISNILISCARLGLRPSKGYLREMERASVSKLSKFSCQGLSNVLWAFVKLGWKPSDAFIYGLQNALQALNAEKCSPQNVANLMWAFAQLRCTLFEGTLVALFDAVRSNLGQYTPQDVSTLLWSAGKLGYAIEDGLFAKIERYCVSRSEGFSLYDVSLSLTGFASRSQKRKEDVDVDVIVALMERTLVLLDEAFSVEAFVHIIWSISIICKRGSSGSNSTSESDRRGIGGMGSALVERYRGELLADVPNLSGYDASKLYCSMAFTSCMDVAIGEKLQAIMKVRMHTYDAPQLQSILHACESLDPSISFQMPFMVNIQEALWATSEPGNEMLS